MLPKVFIFLLTTFAFLFLATSIQAYDPRLFYDWGPYYLESRPSVLGLRVYAQEATATAVIAEPTFLQPDNPFYFVKGFGETFRLAFTFDPVKKEEVRLDLAEERLAEAQALLNKDRAELAQRFFDRYHDTLETATENLKVIEESGSQIEDLAKKIEQGTAIHQTVLEQLLARVPDAARAGIQRAIEASQFGLDRSADLLGKPAVPPEVLERIQALKAQGILSDEEAQRIVAHTSREDLRKDLRALLAEGIFPEADFKRLDEAQRFFFPQEFQRFVEFKKFEELKRLEQEKPDEETQKKLQDFAKDYKPGDIIPPDIRKWWIPTVRLEEIQNTLRPDLLPGNYIRPEDRAKYKELRERFKPTEEQIKKLEEFYKNNPGAVPPPELQRTDALYQNLGTRPPYFEGEGTTGTYPSPYYPPTSTTPTYQQDYNYQSSPPTYTQPTYTPPPGYTGPSYTPPSYTQPTYTPPPTEPAPAPAPSPTPPPSSPTPPPY